MSLFPSTSSKRVQAILGRNALNEYTEMFETIREEYLSLPKDSVSTILDNWRRYQKVVQGTFPENRKMRITLGHEIDPGLIHLLLEENAELTRIAPAKYSLAESLIRDIEKTGLSLFTISPELSDAEIKRVFNHVYEKLLHPTLERDEKKLLGRVKELRRTNPQMRALVTQIAHYNFLNLLDRVNPEVPDKAPLLADLIGMNSKGQIDFDTWSGDQAAFKHAAEELFLSSPGMVKGKLTLANESQHFGHAKSMGLGLSALPAQVFVLKGHDPHEIMETIVKKLTHLYTHRHGENIYTMSLVKNHAKMAFLPFPYLWPSLGIKPGDFLGVKVGEIPEHNLPLDSNANDAWVGIHIVTHMNRLSKTLSRSGVSFNTEDLVHKNGFAAGYHIENPACTTELIDELVRLAEKEQSQAPNIFENADDQSSGRYGRSHTESVMNALHRMSQDKRIDLLFKLIHTNRTENIDGVSGKYIMTKQMLLSIVSKDKALWDNLFDRVLSQKKPKPSVVTEMLNYGTPSRGLMDKLSSFQASKVLEYDLGL